MRMPCLYQSVGTRFKQLCLLRTSHELRIQGNVRANRPCGHAEDWRTCEWLKEWFKRQGNLHVKTRQSAGCQSKIAAISDSLKKRLRK